MTVTLCLSCFMLLERPLSLKLIFHYHTQINRQRDRSIMNERCTYNFFSFFLSLFFFSFFLPARCTVFLFSFFSVLFASVCSFFCWWFVLVFFFLLLSITALLFVLFVDVVLWCLKLSFTVTWFVLSPWRTRLAQAPNWSLLYTHLQHHNDTIIKQTQAERRRKTSL